ncbi:MAG: outer membrane protein assembly factor BamD [Deltaproteobacteria bacterium]|nr:outer membrane protein assembly factor BamD [Deltaproteobacteria bacterium]
MNLKKIVYFAVLLWVSGHVLGCAWFRAKEQETAQGLAEEGMEAFQDEDYKDAIESFQKLKDWYPFSKYAILAELKLGDAYYHRKEYEEAIFAYEAFENLHPKNEAVPYVVYQTGLCYFNRLDSIDRDQSMARDALRAFERLIRTYPTSPYASKAEEHVKVCNRSLAEHEFYVGLFYYKGEHYKAALERFKTVIRSYPDLGVHHKALEYIALCQAKIDQAELDRN